MPRNCPVSSNPMAVQPDTARTSTRVFVIAVIPSRHRVRVKMYSRLVTISHLARVAVILNGSRSRAHDLLDDQDLVGRSAR